MTSVMEFRVCWDHPYDGLCRTRRASALDARLYASNVMRRYGDKAVLRIERREPGGRWETHVDVGAA